MLPRSFYREGSEPESPARQAAAIGLGTFIGCSPFYGCHLLLSLALASALRLNPRKVHVASNISNPLSAPILVAVELEVGARLARGTWYWFATFGDLQLWGLARDLLLGCGVVGGVLAVVTAALTYANVNRLSQMPSVGELIDEAADRYLSTGCSSWEFAHGKLRGDPVYLGLLQRGGLPHEGTLVDCGCGRGLMLSMLAAGSTRRDREWPPGWPAPPGALQLVGIETRPRMVRMARRALEGEATILDGDLRAIALPHCDVILLFDVMHLMPRRDQDLLLGRIREALAPAGLLVVREADAGGGWRFRAVRSFNWLTRTLQGQWGRRFHFCTTDEWRQRLTRAGFDVEAEPMGAGTPFANVAFYARRRASG